MVETLMFDVVLKNPLNRCVLFVDQHALVAQKFNFEACRKWGMKEKYISWLQHGVDLSMHCLPENARLVDNYSTLMDYEDIDKIEEQLEAMVREGCLEIIDKPGLGFVPLGLVPLITS
jgi:hypothetical protein